MQIIRSAQTTNTDNRIGEDTNRRIYPINSRMVNPASAFFGIETGLPLYDSGRNYILELHIFDTNNNLLASDYGASEWQLNESTNNGHIPSLDVDIHNNIRALGIYSGRFNFTYSFLKWLVGSPSTPAIRVDKISKTRKEVRVMLNPDASPDDINRFVNIQNIYRWDNSTPRQKRNLILNFGGHKIYDIVSWKRDTWTYPVTGEQVLVLKLSEPIDKSIIDGNQVGIYYRLGDDISDSILVYPANPGKIVNVLAAPNWNAKVNKIQTRRETGYENYNSIVGNQDITSAQIINKYFSGSDAELNIDYSDFSNFIFYSSTTKRLDNFKYKLRQIESYDKSISDLLSAVSASVTESAAVLSDINKYQSNKNTVIGSFDGFENYMYYQSSSYVSNSYGEHFSRTWPKRTASPPYVLFSYTSSEAEDWYNVVYASASFYDKNNPYQLARTIPEYIRRDEYSEQYGVFVDMVAHQFDMIWLYIKNSLSILDRDESVYNGLSKDLVYYALNSMGWDAGNQYQFDELWEYLLGTDVSGSTPIPGVPIPLQPSQSLIYVESQSLSRGDVNKEIWKRLINNLPYFLKTKGTKRGMQGLLNAYGIPSTILRIREYGGPEPIGDTSQFRYDKFNYALDIVGEDSVQIPRYALQQTSRTPDGIEFRFKTEINGDTFDFPITNDSWSYQSLFRTDDGAISFNIEHSSSIYGNLTMTWAVFTQSTMYEGKATIIENATVFDNGWWSILINKDEANDILSSSGSLFVYLKQANYGEITHEHSGSVEFNSLHANANVQYGIKSAFITSSTWRLGGGPAGPSGSLSGSDQSVLNLYPFTGSIQEFRYWANALGEPAFDNHVCGPIAYNYSQGTGSYENLAMRLSLGSDLHISQSGIADSCHPNQLITTFENGLVISASYYNYASASYDSASYSRNVEEYAMNWPDLSGNRQISNKVRIDDNELIGNLNLERSRELSAFDKFPLDSPKLGVYMSPTNEVDENIAESFGGINIDNYLGDYSNLYLDEYPDLEQLRRYYFKQYQSQFGVIDYIRLVQYFDQTVWGQIKKMSPARSALNTGLVIEPHILNRSRARIMRGQPTALDLQLTCSIDLPLIGQLTGSYDQIYVDISSSNTMSAENIQEYDIELSNQFGISVDNITSSLMPISCDINQDIYALSASMTYENASGSIWVLADVALSAEPIDGADYTMRMAPLPVDGDNLNGQPTELLYSTQRIYFEVSGAQSGGFEWANSATSSDDTSPYTQDWAFVSQIIGVPNSSAATFTGSNSEMIVGYDYHFNIPSDANITGVKVVIVRRCHVGTSQVITASDYYVGLCKNITTKSGDNYAKPAQWIPSTDWSYVEYGGYFDTWGQTWTPAEINSGSFGVQYQVSASLEGSNYFKWVDAIGIAVAYQTSGNLLERTGSNFITTVNWFTMSADYMYLECVQPNITASRPSERLMYHYSSASIENSQSLYHRTYYPADIQDNVPLATVNQRWNGCKLRATAFNIPTLDTVDGGPVIEYYLANPNNITVNSVPIIDANSGTPSNLTVE